MLYGKPMKCHGCFNYDSIIESSTTVQAPGDPFWYCVVCKDEVDDYGKPLSRPILHDDTEDDDDDNLLPYAWYLGID